MNLDAAIWSAAAASFAALSAFLTMRIHRRNLLESARPEIVLTGWSRSDVLRGATAVDTVRIATIRNVGRGAAYNVVLVLDRMLDDPPTGFMSSARFPVIAPGESIEFNGEIVLWWQNIPEHNGPIKHWLNGVKSFAWDSQGRRHVTIQDLFVFQPNVAAGASDEVARGVSLGARRATTRMVMSLKMQSQLARIPLLGRPFRSKDA